MELSELTWSEDDQRAILVIAEELTSSIPEVLDGFYIWLMDGEGGGTQYLRTDQVPSLKRMQHRYWEQFFEGVVDDAYLASRKRVGEVHALIGLPAQVYLRALRVMERLFSERVLKLEHLPFEQRQRSNVALQKLVQLDAAIVLEAFAESANDLAKQREREHLNLLDFLDRLSRGEISTLLEASEYHDERFVLSLNAVRARFAEILRQTREITDGNFTTSVQTAGPRDELGLALVQMQRRLAEISQLAESVAEGDFRSSLRVATTNDTLAISINEMLESFRAVVHQVQAVSAGDLETNIAPRSDADQLGPALATMIGALRETREKNLSHRWIIEAMNAVNDALRGSATVEQVATSGTRILCELLRANAGSMYVLDADDDALRLMSGYAFSPDRAPGQRIRPGEGLVGQVAVSRQPLNLTLPDSPSHRIRSTLVDFIPQSLIIYPITMDDTLVGVIELAFASDHDHRANELLDLANESLAASLDAAASRERTTKLLATSQDLTERLSAQHDELLSANRRLESQTRELEASEKVAKTQRAEIEIANERLEKQFRLLEIQTKELEERNADLDTMTSELELKARDLAQANRYKSEFLANMSHELRTPLNSMLLLSNHLSQNGSNRLSDSEVEAAGVIHRSGQDLLTLINEILDLAKIEAGQMTAKLSHVSVMETVDNVIRTLRPLAVNKALDLSVDCPADLHIQTDQTRLEQILRNLVSNAIKFTDTGSVRIDVLVVDAQLPGSVPANDERKETSPDAEAARRVRPSSLIFRVTDTGTGVPEDMREKIFEAFQQADGRSTRSHGGTGLGLAISRQLASLLGATLELRSTSEAGSCFELVHPLVAVATPLEASPPAVREAPHAPPPTAEPRTSPQWRQVEDDREASGAERKRLLVIEDDVAFAGIVRDFCRAQDYDVLVATSGEEGLALAREFKPAGVFLDLQLPGMDGYAVLDALKQDAVTRHIPIHLVSVEERSMLLLRKGAVGFIQKPVTEGDLGDALARLENTFGRPVKELLVVEDDPGMQIAIRQLLGNGDVLTTAAGSGEEALRLLHEKPFDCMILDLGLPDMSGFDLLNRLRDSTLSIPPVIVYTGRELSRDETHRLREYADSIIIKGARSEERLLDETSIFLHRVIEELPDATKGILSRYHQGHDSLVGRRLLLVDDDMRNIFALSSILEERGLHVVKAENGAHAISILKEEAPFDVILMDLMMPVMDGLTAIQLIRTDLQDTETPIVALTAKAMPDDRRQCIEAGASEYLTKPVEIERLCTTLKALLD